MTEFFKIKCGGRQHLVRVTKRSGRIIVGTRVNRGGEAIERVKGNTVTTFVEVFTKESIICELKMNLHYAELEEVANVRDQVD